MWALNNVLDEIVVTKYVKNEYRYSYWFALGRVPITVFLFLVFGISIPSSSIVLMTILSGFVNALPYFLYYRVLQSVEAYSVALVYVALHPIFTYIISNVFLHDILAVNEIIGFFVLLIAGVFSVLRFDKGISVKKELLLIVPAAVVWAVGDVMFDYVVSYYTNPIDAISWISLGGSFVLLLCWFVPFLRRKCTPDVEKVPRAGYAIFFVTIISIFISYYAFLSALKIGDVALTSSLASSQPLIAFLIALFFASAFGGRLISKKDPRIFSFATLAPKFLALVCAALGVYLISL